MIEPFMTEAGLISLLPTLVVVTVAVMLKRALDALIIGCLVGFMMLSGHTFLSSFLDGVLSSMGDETVRWIILTVALFGSLIALLVSSGGATAFAHALTQRIKTGPQALIATWLLGLAIFIDDYLNALAVGNAMQRVTDKFKISREMLAYVVDTTAAPVCILLPFSTWAIYVSGLLEANGVAETGQGIAAYLQAIPYMLYAWVAVIMPPLVATGKIPLFGSMRRAEQRAQQANQSFGASPQSLSSAVVVEATDQTEPEEEAQGRAGHFVLPMISLIFFTWFFDIDVLKGAFVTLILTMILYRVQGIMDLVKILDTALQGVKQMVEVIAILVMSFVLKDINEQLQLTELIIGAATTWVNPLLLPVITFVALSSIAFATGSFWGLYAVALPIVIPLANAMNMDIYLMIGAVISAGAFGSHTCFYSDSTLLSAQGSGCEPMSHALTQLPYALISAAITAVGFLLLAAI